MLGEDINGDPAIPDPDRRTGLRFPLRLPVWYRPIGSAVNSTPVSSTWTPGESVNISRAGLLFTTPELIRRGETVEALIAWPAFLDNRIPLKLVIKGPVVRSTADGTAMSFGRYEFRTYRTPSGTTSPGL
jgi:hypothetical protein